VTVQPTVSYGNTGNHTALAAAAPTTGLTAAFARSKVVAMTTPNGQTTLTATITVGATATTCMGRFYFIGLLVEDN